MGLIYWIICSIVAFVIISRIGNDLIATTKQKAVLALICIATGYVALYISIALLIAALIGLQNKKEESLGLR